MVTGARRKRMTTYQEINAAARSTQDDIKVRYTADPQLQASRGGVSRSDDGRLDVKFSAPESQEPVPTQRQLFAAGWSACFISAMGGCGQQDEGEASG